MNLKTRYKSFVSSVKKAILKLKEKAVLCLRQSKLTTQTYNETADISEKETIVGRSTTLNCIDLFSAIKRDVQDQKNTIVKWFYSVITMSKTIEIKLIILVFSSIPKYNIQTHYYLS